MTQYCVCTTLDPHSECAVFTSLFQARWEAERVGHCTVYEYEILPGSPGKTPPSSKLIANHHGMTDGSWVRDEDVTE